MKGVVPRVEGAIFIFIELIDTELTVFVVLNGVKVEWGHIFHERRGIEIDIRGVERELVVEKNTTLRGVSEKQGLHGVVEERDVEIIGRVVRLFLYLGHDEIVWCIHKEFALFCVEKHVIPIKFYVDSLRLVRKIYSELDLMVLKREEGQEHLVIAKVKVERKKPRVRRRGRVVNFLGLRVRLGHVVLPDIGDEIKGLGIDLGPTDVKVESGAREL